MQLNSTEHMSCAVMILNIFNTKNVDFDACNTPTQKKSLNQNSIGLIGLLLLFLMLSQKFSTLDHQI